MSPVSNVENSKVQEASSGDQVGEKGTKEGWPSVHGPSPLARGNCKQPEEHTRSEGNNMTKEVQKQPL